MDLLFWSLLLLFTFYAITRVCDDYFIPSLEQIAEKWKMSHDMAGATLMAVGSSAPELFVSMAALLKPGDHALLGAGTIVGSAIFNMLVIIGVSAVARTTVVAWQPIVRDLLFYLLAIILLMVFFSNGEITKIEAGIFIAAYVLYIFAVFYWRKVFPFEDDVAIEEEEAAKENIWNRIHALFDKGLNIFFPPSEQYYRVFFVSIAFIGGISWLLVESGVAIAHILHVPEVVIALTILAIGTSVPDTMSSYIVAKKGKSSMSISNAVGSNIFDIFIGLGLPWLIVLSFSGETIKINTEGLYTSILLLLGSIVVTLIVLLLRGWKIDKVSGYSLIAVYMGYLIYAISSVL